MPNYYSTHAQSFFDSTVSVDMQSLYDQFLPLLEKTDNSTLSILDAGCGSGRDAKAFANLGFEVVAFDACEELVIKARELTGLAVAHESFASYRNDKIFDGIWACASLLHVPFNELPYALLNMANLLKDNGIFYCSFKLGDQYIEKDGRRFTNLNESRLNYALRGLPLSVVKHWQTGDVRAGREHERWFNVILKKTPKVTTA
jgi:SAM-dependent methyltransferase